MSILETKGLVKHFGPTVALDGMTLAVEPGRIVGLLGPNGSGKTTLIKLANGLLVPDAGEIWVDGHQPGRESHAVVSYLPERNSLPLWMTVDQLQDFYADFFADFQRKRMLKHSFHKFFTFSRIVSPFIIIVPFYHLPYSLIYHLIASTGCSFKQAIYFSRIMAG